MWNNERWESHFLPVKYDDDDDDDSNISSVSEGVARQEGGGRRARHVGDCGSHDRRTAATAVFPIDGGDATSERLLHALLFWTDEG